MVRGGFRKDRSGAVMKVCQSFVYTGSWVSIGMSDISENDMVLYINGPLGKSFVKVKHIVNMKLATDSVGKTIGVYFTAFNRYGGSLVETYATVLRQHMNGLSKPFKAFVEVRGLGYKVKCPNENAVEFNVGYSHFCLYKLNPLVKVRSVGIKSRVIELKSTDWLLLRQAVVNVKKIRPPGVYTERGIYEKGERAVCKDGKKKKFG